MPQTHKIRHIQNKQLQMHYWNQWFPKWKDRSRRKESGWEKEGTTNREGKKREMPPTSLSLSFAPSPPLHLHFKARLIHLRKFQVVEASFSLEWSQITQKRLKCFSGQIWILYTFLKILILQKWKLLDIIHVSQRWRFRLLLLIWTEAFMLSHIHFGQAMNI